MCSLAADGIKQMQRIRRPNKPGGGAGEAGSFLRVAVPVLVAPGQLRVPEKRVEFPED